MPTGRENADGFKGEYPKPLDWDRIWADALERSKERSIRARDAAGRDAGSLGDPDSGE